MICDSQVQSVSPAHLEAIRVRAARERIPISGAFDLTYRCNYRCVHCYVGHLVTQAPYTAGELGTAEVARLLSEATEAGCLFMVLSGGEPLLRSDFVEIYKTAKQLGLIVEVFTNASLIRDEHLEAFAEYPPNLVEVSVYGSTAAIYERITGVSGSYERAMRGIESLFVRGVRVGIKTMILRDNVDDVAAIEQLAEHLGVGFRLDPLVMARVDGGRAPLEQRVDPKRAASIELDSASRRADEMAHLSKYLNLVGDFWGMNGHLYNCGAGVTGFHLDPRGYLRPCVCGQDFAYDIMDIGFVNAWREVTAAIDRATWNGAGGCTDCPDIALCGYCPGLMALEGASPARPPDYLCRLGASRRLELESQELAEEL